MSRVAEATGSFRLRLTSVSGFPRAWLNIRRPCDPQPPPSSNRTCGFPASGLPKSSRSQACAGSSDRSFTTGEDRGPSPGGQRTSGPRGAGTVADSDVSARRPDRSGHTACKTGTSVPAWPFDPASISAWRLSAAARLRISPPMESSVDPSSAAGTFFRSGTFVQAVLLTSDENANLAGVLRSTGITPLPRYYGPLRLPTGPASGYVFPRAVEPSSGPEFGSPGRVSQVPRSICRHPPSSATPGSPAAALARCLAVGSRLRPFGKVGHSQLLGFNEAESGSLALRLTSSRSQASTGWLPITSLGSFMANEQLPWSVPFT